MFQELLTTLPVEKLVSKDTSMVHEIRVRSYNTCSKQLHVPFLRHYCRLS